MPFIATTTSDTYSYAYIGECMVLIWPANGLVVVTTRLYMHTGRRGWGACWADARHLLAGARRYAPSLRLHKGDINVVEAGAPRGGSDPAMDKHKRVLRIRIVYC